MSVYKRVDLRYLKSSRCGLKILGEDQLDQSFEKQDKYCKEARKKGTSYVQNKKEG
jgi:hypothetical protein